MEMEIGNDDCKTPFIFCGIDSKGKHIPITSPAGLIFGFVYCTCNVSPKEEKSCPLT